jgi:putative phage-type endonuclease
MLVDYLIDRAKLSLDRREYSGDIIAAIYDMICDLTDQYIDNDYILHRLEKYDKCAKIINRLKEIPEIEQRSAAWYDLRNNMITASDFGQALNKGKFGTQRDFMIKKIDVIHRIANIEQGGYTAPLDWGIKYEDVAAAIYEYRNKLKLHYFGLLQHPNLPYIGASPDAINELGVMLEIKCPYKRVINGEIPTQYYYQIQGQLDVCGLDECDYLECAISEYKCRADFLDDGDKLTRDYMEKGAVISTISQPVKHYYSAIDATNSEKIEWCNNTISDLSAQNIEYKISYWRLDKYHIKRVYRDPAIIAEIYRDIRYLWEKIRYYRDNKSAYIRDILSSKKGRLYDFDEINNPQDKCMIVE